MGAINEQGRVVVEPVWDRVTRFDSQGMALVEKEERWGWINNRGQIIAEPKWKFAAEFDSEGMAAVVEDNRIGWIDRKGNTVIEPYWNPRMVDYSEGSFFDGGVSVVRDWNKFNAHGLVPVADNSLQGCIDRKGKVVVSVDWNSISKFDAYGLAEVTRGKKKGWVNARGSIVSFGWDWVSDFDSEGTAIVVQDKKHGWVNRKGEILIAPKWTFAMPFDAEGMAKVGVDGRKGWINRKGEIAIPVVWAWAENFDRNGIAKVSRIREPRFEDDSDFLFVDRSGELVPSGVLQERETGDDNDEKANATVLGTETTVYEQPIWPIAEDDPREWRRVGEEDPFDFGLHKHGSFQNPYKNAEDFLVLETKAEPDWYQWAKWYVRGLFADEVKPLNEVILCRCYDSHGNLIWSNGWIRFETKCWSFFAVSMVVAMLTFKRSASE